MVLTKGGQELSELIIFLLSNIPVLSSCCIIVGPVLTCRQILRKKTVGSFSAVPFVAFIINGGIWLAYGILTSDSTLMIVNGGGFCAGCIFTLIFSAYGKVPLSVYSFAAFTIFFTMCICLYFPQDLAESILGKIGACASVLLMSSPLASMKTVIQEKDSTPMPLYTSLAMTINGGSWFLFGKYVTGDPYVYNPNRIGFFLGFSQLFLIFLYPPKRNTPVTEETTNFVKKNIDI